MIKTIKRKIFRILMVIWRKLHGVDDKIVFESFDGRQYSDNPRAISEKLHELYPKYLIVWILDDKIIDNEIIPNYVKKVRNSKLNMFRELSTCKVYITNENLGLYINKSQNQFFIQTWHGDRGIKKILYDISSNKDKELDISDNKIVNLCIAGSDYAAQKYRSAFRYNGEVLKVGYPRNDKLININEEEFLYIKQKLNIKDEMVLVYAPTFRDKDIISKQNINLDLDMVLDELEKKYNRKWVCLLRSHPVSSGLNSIENNRIIDVTGYPDMADLLLIADFLITDYSSSGGDFILKNKPLILFQPDIRDYTDNSRELDIDCKEAGYMVAENTEAVINLIKNKNELDFAESCNKLKEFYGVNETGKSSEIICNRIYDWIENN